MGQNRYTDERYVLNGLNMSTPDQLIQNGESPMALNCRMFARESQAKRVAIKTRKGAGFFSVPVGEALDQQQTGTTGAADQTFTKTSWIAQKYTAGASGRLTAIELRLKKNSGTGTVLVEFRTDNAGSPGSTITAITGVTASSITSSYAYVKLRLMDAPEQVSGTSYWIIVHSQDDDTNPYQVSSTTDTALAKTSTNGNTWTSQTWSINFKTYVATSGAVLGHTRRYAQNGSKETILAHKQSIYKVSDVDGSTTLLKSGFNAAATKYRFANFNDKQIVVNGYDTPQQYNGTTMTDLTGTPSIPDLVAAHKGRLFFSSTTDTRVYYSALQNETSYPSVNFFYVPTPKSSDKVTALIVFQDSLVVFTKNSKYILNGSDLASFTLRQSIGTKGAVSQEAVWADRNYVYFATTDGVYRWNGSTDELISDKVQPEYDSIPDKNAISLSVHNNGLRVYYPGSGSSYENKMLLLDMVYNQWFVDDGIATKQALTYPQDTRNGTTPFAEASSLVGAIYYGEQGYSDLGKPINFKYWTSYNKYISGREKDRIRSFYPIMRPSGYTFTMRIGKDIDFQNNPDMRDYAVVSSGSTWGGGATWGSTATWGSSTLQDAKQSMSGRGKHTQYRFERYGANTPVELYGYVAIIKSGRIR